MRISRSILAVPVAAGLAVSSVIAAPAAAQDTPLSDAEIDASQLAEKLSDPAMQAQLSTTLATLSQVLLDLPLAPLAQAVADAAGEDAGTVDPDMTLRKMAPDSDTIPQVIEEELPRAMDRMAGMAGAIEAMAPALREMARAMESAARDIELD